MSYSQVWRMLEPNPRGLRQVLGVSRVGNTSRPENHLQMARQLIEGAKNPAFTDSERVELTSRAFAYVYHEDRASLAVAKRHEAFVVLLLGKKLSRQAWKELTVLHTVLTTTKETPGSPLEGVAFTGSKESTPHVIAFYFLVFQCALQHMSQNLKTVALDSDPGWNLATLNAVARHTLSSSDFSRWIAFSYQEGLSPRGKHHSNLVKIVGGFLKIAKFLGSKVDDRRVKEAVCALELKSVELCGGEPPRKVPPACAPYLEDLRRERPHLAEINTVELAINTVEPATRDACVNTPVPVTDETIHDVLKCIQQNPTPRLIDKATVYAKGVQSPHAYDILCSLFSCIDNDTRRMRNVANLMFNLAKRHASVPYMEQCLDMEARIHACEPSPANLGAMSDKLARAAGVLRVLAPMVNKYLRCVKAGPMNGDELDFLRGVVLRDAISAVTKLGDFHGIGDGVEAAVQAAVFVQVCDSSTEAATAVWPHLLVGSFLHACVYRYWCLVGTHPPTVDRTSAYGIAAGIHAMIHDDNYDPELVEAVPSLPQHLREDAAAHTIGYLSHKDQHGQALVCARRWGVRLVECSLAFELGLVDDIPRLLSESGAAVKNLKPTTQQVLEWKLLQLEHTLQNNVDAAHARIDALATFVRSKPDFDLGARVPLPTKFTNLRLLARFHLIVSRFHVMRTAYDDAYNSGKMAIKLALLVLRKVPPSLSRLAYNITKWDAQRTLATAYHHMLEVLLYAGLTKDASLYIKELAPLSPPDLQHHLVRMLTMMERPHDADELLSSIGPVHGANGDVLASRAADLVACAKGGVHGPDLRSETAITTASAMSDSEVQKLHRPIDGDAARVEFDHAMSVYRPRASEYAVSGRHAALAALVSAKHDLSLLQRKLRRPVATFPALGPTRGTDALAADLVRIKLALFAASQADLQVHEAHDLARVACQCVVLLASVAPAKKGVSELASWLHLLLDLPRQTPVHHHRLSAPTQLVPEPLSPAPVHLDFVDHAAEFASTLAHLPNLWAVVALDITPENHLIVTRHGEDGFIASVPLRKPFGVVRDEFLDIIEQSAHSVKASTTSRITTKQDRQNWWKLRFSLDLRLKEVLDTMDNDWLGCLRGAFARRGPDAVYDDFAAELAEVWARHCTTPLSDTFVKLVYHADSPGDESTDAVDRLIDAVHPKAPASLRHAVYRLISSYGDTKRAMDASQITHHVLLIPLSRCSTFPWESINCLRDVLVTRMPSLEMTARLLQTYHTSFSPKSVHYIVNPEGDLKRTENTFRPKLENLSVPSSGTIGTRPPDSCLSDVVGSDLFVYLGHGGCEQYISPSALASAESLPPSLLIGCLSGALKLCGHLEPHGNIYNWLAAGSPMVLVNLWDVTDKDIDAFSDAVLNHWGLTSSHRGVPISTAVARSRNQCTLRYLNGLAPVVYGLPLSIE